MGIISYAIGEGVGEYSQKKDSEDKFAARSIVHLDQSKTGTGNSSPEQMQSLFKGATANGDKDSRQAFVEELSKLSVDEWRDMLGKTSASTAKMSGQKNDFGFYTRPGIIDSSNTCFQADPKKNFSAVCFGTKPWNSKEVMGELRQHRANAIAHPSEAGKERKAITNTLKGLDAIQLEALIEK